MFLSGLFQERLSSLSWRPLTRLQMVEAVAVVLSPLYLFGQSPLDKADVPRFVSVSAPYAQHLLTDMKKSHMEIKKIGLHAIPPGQGEYCVIANPLVEKIGKISSPADLAVLASGTATVVTKQEEGRFYDMKMPISDAAGHPVGLMVLEIPAKFAPNDRLALVSGLRLRDELSGKIPSKTVLFAPDNQR